MTSTPHTRNFNDTHPRDMVVEPIVRPLPARLRWGAVIAGTVAALGLWILLYALGGALGLTAVEPGNDQSVNTGGTLVGVWAVIAPLVALFVGGLVAGRVAGAATKLTGALHGLVMWGITAIAGVWLVGMLATSLAIGTVDVAKTVVPEVAESFALNASDAMGPMNARRMEAGQPAIAVGDLRNATKDAVTQAVRDGKIDREMFVTALSQQTAMTRPEAAATAERIEKQYQEGVARAKYEAQIIAEDTGKAFWGIFAALLAGLLASMAGALLGVTREQRLRAETVVGVDVHPRNEPITAR